MKRWLVVVVIDVGIVVADFVVIIVVNFVNRKSRGLKRFEITYEVSICTIDVAGIKPDLNKVEKTPKICNKKTLFYSFFNFVP